MVGLASVRKHNLLVFVYITVGTDPYTNYIIDLNMNTNQYSLFTGGAYGLVIAVSSLFTSYLVDILPRRILYGTASICWSGSLIAVSLANNFTQAFIGHLAVGFFASVSGPCCISLINDTVPLKYRTTALSFINIGALLGIAFSSLSTILDTHIGWRHSI